VRPAFRRGCRGDPLDEVGGGVPAHKVLEDAPGVCGLKRLHVGEQLLAAVAHTGDRAGKRASQEKPRSNREGVGLKSNREGTVKHFDSMAVGLLPRKTPPGGKGPYPLSA
jgi:hypothetical protein